MSGTLPAPGGLTFSVVIPAHNEEEGVRPTVERLYGALMAERIPFEILIVNDHSTDQTEAVLQQLARELPGVRYVNNPKPGGFGFAIQTGLERFRGDAVCIVMADASDDPRDVVAYYRQLEAGYECVFGSRFMRGSRVVDYPLHKLVVNRLANKFIDVLFRLRFNDTTNAFKAYRRETIEGVKPFLSSHFNITVELPLKAITRGYTYTTLPINWYNRATGVSKLKIKEMGSRYLFIVLYVWLEQLLSRGDYRRKASISGAIHASTASHVIAALDVSDIDERLEAEVMNETLPRISSPHTANSASTANSFPGPDGEARAASRVTVAEPAAPQRAEARPRPAEASGAPTTTIRPLLTTHAARVASLSVALLPLAMLAIILWGIWNRTPHVPFWDEWRNVDLALHLKQGTLSFTDFWAFHNEHRIVIPRMLYLALVVLSHWNEQVIMTFDLGLAVVEAGLLLAAVRRGLRSTGWMIALVIPFSLLVFSLGQYENWLWAFQITFICTVLGVAFCVFAFARQPASWAYLLLGMAGALLAAWSSVGGTLAWVAFLPAAWRAGRAKGAVWTATAAVVFITYFQNFPQQAPIHFAPGMLGFAIGYLGAPLAGVSIHLALLAGVLSIVFVLVNLLVYWRAPHDGVTLDAWFGLALFALAVDGVTTLGRYRLFGFNDLLTSRYQVFSVLWWVALLTLAAINAQRAHALLRGRAANQPAQGTPGAPLTQSAQIAQLTRAMNLLALALCCLALIGANIAVWGAFKNYLYAQRLDEICVANYETAPDNCLRGFLWDPTYLRSQAQILDEYQLGIFNNDVSSTRPLTLYTDARTGDQWATTDLVDTQSGYTEVTWLGLLYINPHVGAQPLYQCLSNTTHTHFLSRDTACDGQQALGIEGWISTSPIVNDSSAALYRCAASAAKRSNGSAATTSVISTVSTDGACNGAGPGKLLGYILTRTIPWA